MKYNGISHMIPCWFFHLIRGRLKKSRQFIKIRRCEGRFDFLTNLEKRKISIFQLYRRIYCEVRLRKIGSLLYFAWKKEMTRSLVESNGTIDVHECAVKLAVRYTRVPTRNALFCPIKPNVLLQSRFALLELPPRCLPEVLSTSATNVLRRCAHVFDCALNVLINDVI